MLTTNHEWPRLWVLAQKLPLAWGVRIIQSLAQAGWRPDDPAEQALLADLAALAGANGRSGLLITLQSLNRQTPPAVERARLHLRHGKLNGVAFDPRSPVLALVSSRRRVVLWNYQTGQVVSVIKTTAQNERFAHSLGSICYTKRGTLVFAERTRSDEFCRVYAEIDGQIKPIFNETGSITALAPVGENSVLAAGRSMFVSRLDLDNPARPAARQVFTNWARGLAVSADGQEAALLHQGVTLVNAATLDRTATGYGGGQVIPCAAFTPDGSALIAGRLNGEVRVFRKNDYLEIEKRTLPRHSGPVQGIIAFQKFPLILTTGAGGLMRFTTWPERKRYGESGQDGDTIASLSMSRDETSLAVIHGEDRIALWDLRPLELPALLSQPLTAISPIQFASLQSLAALDGLPEGLHKSIDFSVRLLHHRFRYDVEIETSVEIAAGEFDIEIGDEVEEI
jgi:WD40 repeat protein